MTYPPSPAFEQAALATEPCLVWRNIALTLLRLARCHTAAPCYGPWYSGQMQPDTTLFAELQRRLLLDQQHEDPGRSLTRHESGYADLDTACRWHELFAEPVEKLSENKKLASTAGVMAHRPGIARSMAATCLLSVFCEDGTEYTTTKVLCPHDTDHFPALHTPP